jgi:transposase
MTDDDTLPQNVDDLTKLVITQRDQLAHQSLFIDQLLEQIKLAQHQRFGVKSEHISPDQLRLLLDDKQKPSADDVDIDDEPSEPQEAAKPAKRAKRGRRKLPDHLPRVEIQHSLSDEACCCEHCQTELTPVSQKITEQLDIVPAQVRVIRHYRQTYQCPHCDAGLATAPLPPQPIPKSNATPGTLTYLIVAKYLEGMPLYRLERQLSRYGMPVPRATLASWMIQCGQLVQPLINLMRDRLLSYDIIAMDESRYQVLKEAGKTPQSQSYIWVQRGGPPDSPVILYDYDPSRSQSVPMRLLDGFKGYLQTDAYEGYGQVCRENELISVGCMAHARRKFDEALKAQSSVDPNKQKSTLAAQALKQIQALYRIEREIKLLSSDEIKRARQARSVPLLNELKTWLDANIIVVPPRSTLGKAMNYLNKQWDKLTVYTTDGRLRIDNNLCENAVRPFVMGRKSWLFANSVAGANASANLYSLVETAKANGHEPYAYIKQVLTDLPAAQTLEDIEALLPFNLQPSESKAA